MRIDISAYMDKDNDGYEGSSNITRDDVEDLYVLADVFTQAVKNMGFTYVNAVGFEKDDGTMIWGDV